MIKYSCIIFLLSRLSVSCLPSELPKEELIGFWSAEVKHNNQTSIFTLQFSENDSGDTFCQVHLPAINAEINLGPISLDHQNTIRFSNFDDIEFYYDEERNTINGLLPSLLVPTYKIECSLKKSTYAIKNETPINESIKKPEWSFKTEGAIWSAPVIDQNTIYFGSNDTRIYALDKNTKKEKWSYKTLGAVRSAVVIDQDFLFVLSDDGFLYKLDKKEGKLIWKLNTGPFERHENSSYIHYSATPLVFNNKIFFGNLKGDFYCLEKQTGDLIWKFSTSKSIVSSAVIHQGKIYFGGLDHHVYALDHQSGELIWKFDSTQPIVSTPALFNNSVIIGSRSYDLFALDANTGQKIWNYYNWFSWIESSGKINNDTLYIGSSDAARVYAMNPQNGQIFWDYQVKGWALSTPAVNKESVFMGTIGTTNYIAPHTGVLYSIDKKSGKLNWKFAATSPGKGNYGFSTSPALNEEKLYVGALDSTLYVFDLTTPSVVPKGQMIRNMAPNWSPDGKKIVYYSNRKGNNEIYVMNADGSDSQQLTENPSSDYLPKFSPDGTRILYFSGDKKRYNIYLMNADGSDKKQLTDNESRNEDPNWLPDGSGFIYNTNESGNQELIIKKFADNKVLKLTSNNIRDFTGSMSSDGSQIIFVRSITSDSNVLFLMNADGSDQRQLMDSNQQYTPTWSPDDQYIYYMHRGQNNDIFRWNVEKKISERITTHPADDIFPSCSPDGKFLAFCSKRDTESYEIYVMELVTKSIKRITFDSK